MLHGRLLGITSFAPFVYVVPLTHAVESLVCFLQHLGHFEVSTSQGIMQLRLDRRY